MVEPSTRALETSASKEIEKEDDIELEQDDGDVVLEHRDALIDVSKVYLVEVL